MTFQLERVDPADFGLDLKVLDDWLRVVGPVAVLHLETTGAPESRSAELLELGVLLLSDSALEAGSSLIRPRRGVPDFVLRRTGLSESALRSAEPLASQKAAIQRALRGPMLLAHDVDFERRFLARDVDSRLASAKTLDTQDLLSFTHPDATDLRIETVVGGRSAEAPPARALDHAAETVRLLSSVASGAQAAEPRYRTARQILERHLPDSPWLGLLAAAKPGGGLGGRSFVDFARSAAKREQASEPTGDATVAESDRTPDARFVEIGETDEAPVPFEMEAILAALSDAERGQRHFPAYRVREEQLELAREFVHVLRDGGVAKLEGGTGVGKSLAYLAAAIPFAMDQASAGVKEPVLLSTRTKILQDQLLLKDIAAAARFLGYPNLRALSIKGRANYVCERRLASVLGEARDASLLSEAKTDFALLEACARIRPQGEIGTVPAALLKRNPKLRELLRASVAVRSEQCSREQCSVERDCPFGRHRRALAKAHLVVANHDLLLRWPPDYPSFSQAIMDEGHEIGGVAEEVFALRVRPEEIGERLEELFGAPVRRGAARSAAASSSGSAPRRYASRGLVAPPDAKSEEATIRQNRRDCMLELIGLGRAMSERADAFGGTELPENGAETLPVAAELARSAARRLEHLAETAARAGPAQRFQKAEDAAGQPTPPQRDLDAEEDAERQIGAHVEALRGAALGLRTAFVSEQDDYVGAFEHLESPHDRWTLVLRPVAPADAFREEFLEKMEGLAVVSATLFVSGDAFAALGELGLGEGETSESWSRAVGSPFPYEQAMRVVALRTSSDDLIEETAESLAVLARALGGRCLGLFTSLARMRQTADRLTELLADDGIDVLVPRGAGDDPRALVERFAASKGGAVLLGARRFWQGIDVRGEGLQAVVIEKLPFEVPTELRRRRDDRLRSAGENPFSRSSVPRMLLHLKQMSGRLIRSETDRGMVVIIDARRDKSYFRRLGEALPPGTKIEIAPREDLPRIAEELGLGS